MTDIDKKLDSFKQEMLAAQQSSLTQWMDRVDGFFMKAHEAIPPSHSQLIAELTSKIDIIRDAQVARIEEEKKFKDSFLDHLEDDEKMRQLLTNHIAPLSKEDREEKDKAFEERIERALKKSLYGGGLWTFRAVVGLSVFTAALIAIFGGFKTLLAYAGIVVSKKI